MRYLTAPGRTEVRESRPDVLALPILIAVALLAVVVRQLMSSRPSATVIGVCAGLAALDLGFGWLLLRSGAASLVITPDDITFTPRRGKGTTGAPAQVLHRTGASTLTFRRHGNVARPGEAFVELRDTATGTEIDVTPFRKVRQACTSQGWPFA